MISLDVQEYCDNCLDFSPEVEKPQKIVKSNNMGSNLEELI